MASHNATLHLTDTVTLPVNVHPAVWDKAYYCISNDRNDHLYAHGDHIVFTKFCATHCSIMQKINDDNEVVSFDDKIVKYCPEQQKFSFDSGSPIKLILHSV